MSNVGERARELLVTTFRGVGTMYEALTKQDRADLHERVADWLERRHPERARALQPATARPQIATLTRRRGCGCSPR